MVDYVYPEFLDSIQRSVAEGVLQNSGIEQTQPPQSYASTGQAVLDVMAAMGLRQEILNPMAYLQVLVTRAMNGSMDFNEAYFILEHRHAKKFAADQ